MEDRKKKILFVCYGLGIGGIEKCLVNLLNSLQEELYSVDLLLMNPQYKMKNQIKRKVRYLDTFQYVMNIEDTLCEIKQRGGILHNLGSLLEYCVFRFRIKMGKNAWLGFKPLPEKYDIAVAYSQNDYSPYYVIDKVQADRKVLWYHNGAYEREGKKYERDKGYYSAFTYVVAVSTDCAKMLKEKFDFSDGKLIVLRNICDVKSIVSKSQAFVPKSFETETFHIVTVGRMTTEKGANLAVKACEKLYTEGRNICWHWVGDGNQVAVIKEMVVNLGLQGSFIFEGNQDNPYPYIRCSDVYVQTSYYEAYSTTITEAKVLGRPIVTTDVGGMRDQITHQINGLIVPIDFDAIADAIKMLMDDKNMRSSFTAELGKENYCSDVSMLEYQKTVFS